MKQKAALFWSGGKDSAMALYNIQIDKPEFEIKYLVTTVNEEYERISMHGVRESLLAMQADAIGIPLLKMIVPNIPSNDAYETALHNTLSMLKKQGVNYIIFGDIFLENLKQYRLKLLEKHQVTGVFPLWKKNSTDLMNMFFAKGFKTVTCCVSTQFLAEEHVGKLLDEAFLSALPPVVDPCGENGEFHTFCFDGPVFNAAIPFLIGEKQFKPLLIQTDQSESTTGFWYVDLLPVNDVDAN